MALALVEAEVALFVAVKDTLEVLVALTAAAVVVEALVKLQHLELVVLVVLAALKFIHGKE